jgi:large subunit ribosomal protein L29
MSNKKSRELHSLDTPELLQRLQDAQNDLIGLRFNFATRKTQNTARLKDARRQIARIKTILVERSEEA